MTPSSYSMLVRRRIVRDCLAIREGGRYDLKIVDIIAEYVEWLKENGLRRGVITEVSVIWNDWNKYGFVPMSLVHYCADRIMDGGLSPNVGRPFSDTHTWTIVSGGGGEPVSGSLVRVEGKPPAKKQRGGLD